MNRRYALFAPMNDFYSQMTANIIQILSILHTAVFSYVTDFNAASTTTDIAIASLLKIISLKAYNIK
jgi:hypothetical protein